VHFEELFQGRDRREGLRRPARAGGACSMPRSAATCWPTVAP
jgi:hypothetical protein